MIPAPARARHGLARQRPRQGRRGSSAVNPVSRILLRTAGEGWMRNVRPVSRQSRARASSGARVSSVRYLTAVRSTMTPVAAWDRAAVAAAESAAAVSGPSSPDARKVDGGGSAER